MFDLIIVFLIYLLFLKEITRFSYDLENGKIKTTMEDMIMKTNAITVRTDEKNVFKMIERYLPLQKVIKEGNLVFDQETSFTKDKNHAGSSKVSSLTNPEKSIFDYRHC
jgi:hypothetical protein